MQERSIATDLFKHLRSIYRQDIESTINNWTILRSTLLTNKTEYLHHIGGGGGQKTLVRSGTFCVSESSTKI